MIQYILVKTTPWRRYPTMAKLSVINLAIMLKTPASIIDQAFNNDRDLMHMFILCDYFKI